MPATPDELLERIAATLREQIGPNIGEPFAKTQAFMAAVILDKLAGQLRSAAADGVIADEQRRALVETLRDDDTRGTTVVLREAIAALGDDDRDANWSRLVAAVYAGREELGGEHFDHAIGLVRTALRARLDRMLAYSA